MSWLEHLDIDFKYRCEACGTVNIHTLPQSDRTYLDPHPCKCGSPALYAGFLPIQTNIRGRVAFDQNGRKGYAITDGKGNTRYISATKLRYQETGDVVPQYTNAYQEKLKSEGKEHLLESKSYKDIVEDRTKNQEIIKTRSNMAKASDGDLKGEK